MSTSASKRPMKRFIRDPRCRKMVLDVDLNVMPPGENRAQEVTATSRGVAQGGQVSGLDVGCSASVSGRLHNTPIDVEAINDEVMISSPRRFTEAGNHSRRNQVVTVVLDEDLDLHQNRSGSVAEEPMTGLTLNSFNNLGRNSANGAVINYYEHINLESNQSAKARNRSRRNQVVSVVLDEDLDVHQNCSGPVAEELMTRLTLNSFNNLERNSAIGAVINYECINLESNQSAKRKKVAMLSQEPPPQNTAPKEIIFSCAICMGAMVEETSTTCGHIFCMKCIKAAIAAQKKCPTCRRKLSASNIHRVYLPTTN